MSHQEAGERTVVVPPERVVRQKALMLAATQCSIGDYPNLRLGHPRTTDSAWGAANAAAFWIVAR